MKRVFRAFVHPAIFAPLLAAYIGGFVLPASVWFNPRAVVVDGGKAGTVPIVYVDRAIKYSFYGSYTVDVRSTETGRIICGKGGSHHYQAGLVDPFTTTLPDWAGGDDRCATLPAGQYTIETCWTVLYPVWGLLPPKTICAGPTPFRVAEKDE